LVICAAWIFITHFIFQFIINRKRIVIIRFVNRITFFELVNWVAIYSFVTSFLNEVRVSALLIAFIGIIFVLPNAGFLVSLLLSFTVGAIYLIISYYQIYYSHQNGVFPLELT
jgi:hypothetical protein